MSTARGELDSPPAVGVLLVGFDVPLPWAAGIDSDYLDTIVRRIRDIEVLPIVDALESPAITVLDNRPLRMKSRSDKVAERDGGVAVYHTFWLGPPWNPKPIMDL